MPGVRKKVASVLIVGLLLFLFAPGAYAQTTSFWSNSSVPAFVTGSDSASVELGTKFSSSVAGSITAIRFYKATNSTGTHVGTIWSSAGSKLASVTFSGETASGWQTQQLSSPLAISAGVAYVVSYHTVQYADSYPYFSQSLTVGPLTAPINAGVYAYGTSSIFPTSTWNASTYWVDIVFAASTQTTTAPSIATQPAGQTVMAGQAAIFLVSAAGTAPLSYQWRKNGTNIAGATSSSYTTPATTATDNGAQFSVVVSNTAGSITSNNATLTVNSVTAPSITTQPSNQTVVAGQTAMFSVIATGTTPMSYQWEKNGTSIAGATSSIYTTPATTASDNGTQFSVAVGNSAGSITSNGATLTVSSMTTAPSITTQPASQTVAVGQTATFSVSASGTAPLTYQWRKNGTNISGATSSSYTTPAATAADSGSQFSVVVSNSAGSVTSANAALTVTSSQNCPCSIWTSNAVPGLVDGGVDSPVELGVTFRSDVSGYITGIRFYKSTANTGTHIGNLWSSAGTMLASATFASETASGWQQVSFANPVAITANTSYVASYHVNSGHYSVDLNYFANSGVDSAPLHALANVNGAADGPYTYGSTSAFPKSTYQSSNYWVDVVFVNTIAPTAPVITSQPAGQTVIAGQTATFSVGASGSTPMNYQWRKNGANISGATSPSYTTPAATTADSGALFSVVASNTVGTATSSNAALTVSAATKTLTLNPTSLIFGNVNISSSGTLSATVTNTGNSSVTISGVSVSGAGFTVSGVSTGQIITAGQSATLNVKFAPASTGSVTGSARISSDAGNSPSTVALSGAGVQLVTHSTNLLWNASTSTVNGYNVYSSTVSGGPYTKANANLVGSMSYTDSTVQSGKTYYYVVTAVNSSSVESTYSNQVTAAIP